MNEEEVKLEPGTVLHKVMKQAKITRPSELRGLLNLVEKILADSKNTWRNQGSETILQLELVDLVRELIARGFVRNSYLENALKSGLIRSREDLMDITKVQIFCNHIPEEEEKNCSHQRADAQ